MKDKEAKRHISFYLINAITLYRLVATALLVYLALSGQLDLFKWLLAFSFFTDMIDGTLARKFKVVSVLGSRLDSVADDLTVVVAFVGMFIFRHGFLEQNIVTISILFTLYLVQMGTALVKYHKLTSFHTKSAKLSFLLQGCFLILIFFLPDPPMVLFYAAVICTAIQLTEETIMIWLLPKWKSDVKGLYWVLRDRKKGARI